MNIKHRALLPLLAMLAGGSVHAANEEMVFLAPTNTAMPLARFTNGQLSEGILKDLGAAIAHQLGREARFVSMPSKRVGMAMRNNEADAVCYVLPQWMDGQFHWSRPLLPNAAILVAHPDAPPIRTLKDLAGKKVGTVNGYRYPELDALLGKDFLRDDAPSTEHSLNKLAAGRTRYAIVGKSMLEYRQRTDKRFKIRIDHVFAGITAQCALAPGSRVLPVQFDKAINNLVDTGAVVRILSNYR
jgi:polar amino acid transport system substrate-binding protein